MSDVKIEKLAVLIDADNAQPSIVERQFIKKQKKEIKRKTSNVLCQNKINTCIVSHSEFL